MGFEKKSSLQTLQGANSIQEIAKVLGFEPRKLAYILYKQSDSSKYKEFKIPKKSGGFRQISAPNGGLKLLQTRLAELLQECQEELEQDEDIEPLKRDFISHGFKRQRTICTNARQHKNRRYVFNVDLHDFFGTINFGRVRGFFIKDKRFNLDPKVATIIAQIACFRNSLPQGSPCSPIISNLVAHILDIHLVRIALRAGCVYTRYADDMTFSTNKRCFPSSIATKSNDSDHIWLPGPELSRVLNHSGFKVNPKKTRMQYAGSRQEVTGLVVNKKINIRSEYRHNVRAMVHQLCTQGSFWVRKWETDDDGTTALVEAEGSLNQLQGKLSFINDVDLYNLLISEANLESAEISKKREEILREKGRDALNKQGKEILESKERIYRRFLLYKEFYAPEKPVLICEGWTDYVYIENALQKLAARYQQLISLEQGKEANFLIKRFRTASKTSSKSKRTAAILGIRGGVKDLGKFAKSYKAEFRDFSAPGMEEPVIILLDNDDAGKNVAKDVCKRYHIKDFSDEKTHFHICENLYIVLVPLPCDEPAVENNKKGTTAIEDLFNEATLNIKVDGKSFQKDNKGVTASTYGKAVFAKEVVTKQRDSINFDGFIPLLDRIVEVIEMHRSHKKR